MPPIFSEDMNVELLGIFKVAKQVNYQILLLRIKIPESSTFIFTRVQNVHIVHIVHSSANLKQFVQNVGDELNII